MPERMFRVFVPVGELLFGRKRVAIRTDLIIKRMLQTFAGPENNFNFEA